MYPPPAPWLGGLLTSGYSDVLVPGWLGRGLAGAEVLVGTEVGAGTEAGVGAEVGVGTEVGAGNKAGAGEDIRASGREDQNWGKS
jgi:hypothetical protein